MSYAHSISSSELRDLGHSAADLAGSNGIGLTEAVVRTIGHQKLSSHQVRRVVEAANHHAFASKYAQTSGMLRAVEFDNGPADPEVVLDALRASTSAGEKLASLSDYSLPPQAVPTTFASERSPVEGNLRGVQALHEKLALVQEECVAQAEAARWEARDAYVSLHKQASNALLLGAQPDHLYEAWSRIDGDLAKEASARLGLRLSGVKVAGVVNPDHPVVGAFAALHAAVQDIVRYDAARVNVETELLKLSAAIKEYRS